MNKSTSCVIAVMAILTAGVIKSNAGCYYTALSVCVPSGTILTSKAVYCHCGSECTATLYNQTTTTDDAYTTSALSTDANHTSGHTGVLATIVSNTVGVQTTTVDPATCIITIDPSAGTATITCEGTAADPDSPPCHFAQRVTNFNSYYCLAVL